MQRNEAEYQVRMAEIFGEPVDDFLTQLQLRTHGGINEISLFLISRSIGFIAINTDFPAFLLHGSNLWLPRPKFVAFGILSHQHWDLGVLKNPGGTYQCLFAQDEWENARQAIVSYLSSPGKQKAGPGLWSFTLDPDGVQNVNLKNKKGGAAVGG